MKSGQKQFKNPTLKAASLVLVFVMLITSTLAAAVPSYADGAAKTNLRMYCYYEVTEGPIGYQNSGNIYDTSDEWTISMYDDVIDPYLFFPNSPDAVYRSMTPEILEISEQLRDFSMEAHLTFKGTGTARIEVNIPSTSEYYSERTVYVNIEVLHRNTDPDPGTGDGNGNTDPDPGTGGDNGNTDDPGTGDTSETVIVPKTQKISGLSTIKATFGKTVSIGQKANTSLKYKSSNTSTATVSSTGKVTFRHPGTVTITVNAVATEKFYAASKKIKVTSALASPKLKCSARKKRANKLSWSKVGPADGYELYIKYPGSKKYVKAVTKKASVKSVTHKGITSGKKYSYKIRAFVKYKGKKYYSSFSKVITVKVK